MGKPKKGKKGAGDEDFGDEDAAVDILAQKADSDEEADAPATNKQQPQQKKGKKGKKKKDEDWEDDVATEIAAMSLEANNGMPAEEEESEERKPSKKEKKKKKKDKENEEDEETAEKPSKGGLSAFQMLAMDDDVDGMDDEEEEEDLASEKSDKLQKQKSTDNEEQMESSAAKSSKQKKDKKKKKEDKKKAEDEDLDMLLAEIEKPQEKAGKKKKKKKGGDEEAEAQEQPEEESALDTALKGKDLSQVTQEDLDALLDAQIDESEYDKKKKKKKDKKKEDASAEAAEEEEGEEKVADEEGEDGGTVKTAAQKKKEKKERQKLQKQQEKEKAKQQKKKGASNEEKEESPAPAAEVETAAKDEGEAAEGEEEDDKKKKKKDRKKKKKGEEEEETKKKPKKAQIKAMQEALQKVKEEEERLKQEEEEKERKREEARRLKEEKERLEKERKEKKKQKEKEKIARKKAEGTYLTAKQKEERRRAEQMLEAMKARGIELPVKTTDGDVAEKPKRRVVYDNRKKKKQQQGTEESPTPEPTPDREEAPQIGEVKEEDVKVEVKEEVKEAWDAEEEVKDAWDVSDEEEKPEETEKPKEKAKPVAEEEDEEEEESSEEESEEESSEESSEEESSEEESSSEEDDGLTPQERAREKAKARMQKRKQDAEAKKSTDKLRAPVVCVLGHVDTGKTKILDKLRRTNVQDGEAGGITQQIGATNVPYDAIINQTKMCKEFAKKELKLPGLLIIDTPGHESFSNLRSRGSSLCDIAILVIDIMHGIEPQTVESINLLKERKTPFVVALNKIDRLYQWQTNPHSDVVNTIKKQKPNTKIEFEERAKEVIVQLAEQGLNAALFYENKNPREYISLVPTSAHSGDGMGNLIALICDLTQTLLAKRVSYSEELQATVMEVKAIEGLGTTIDVVLVNGKIREGDTIIVAGTRGPISTQIRGLLMPQPMRELRVKSAYEHHKEVLAAQGVKISAKELDTALAGLPLFVAQQPDEVEILKEEMSAVYKDVLSSIKLEERGVFVQASTLGSLEALLEFLRTSKIPYAGINIGPVHKRDIMKASVMLEHDVQYAVILAFDIKVEREAQELADSLGVRIFTAEIIYHLFDQFTAYQNEFKAQKKEEFKDIAVFPCKLRVLPECVFKTRDPIVVGVSVEAGFVKEGTPICVPSKENLFLGRVSGIEHNHKQQDMAKTGQEICIKIEALPGDTPKMYGRHFDHNDLLVSKITRQSIDAVKDHFRDEMQKSDWVLMVELKKVFQIL